MKHIGNNSEEAALKRSNLGYVLVLIAALMWGSIGIFVNGISAMGVSSQSMAAFRLLVGALILAPVLMFMGCRPDEGSTVAQGPLALFKASPKELVSCALVGIVGLAAANTCYYECMGEVGMSTASVLLYTSPVFGVVLGRVLYREDVTPNKLVAIAFNIGGCVLAVTNGDLSGFHFSVWGVTSGVIAGLCGASLAVFSRIATKTVHPLAVTFWALFLAVRLWQLSRLRGRMSPRECRHSCCCCSLALDSSPQPWLTSYICRVCPWGSRRRKFPS